MIERAKINSGVESAEKRWHLVRYESISSGTIEKLCIECNGTEHRKIVHNPVDDTYREVGEPTPCDGNHNPLFAE